MTCSKCLHRLVNGLHEPNQALSWAAGLLTLLEGIAKYQTGRSLKWPNRLSSDFLSLSVSQASMGTLRLYEFPREVEKLTGGAGGILSTASQVRSEAIYHSKMYSKLA